MLKTLAALICTLTAAVAFAEDGTPNLLLHGFGEWAYSRTDGNEYLHGTEDGDYNTLGFGLNASSTVGDHFSITGQLALRTREEDQPRAELDYAFAQWRFSDALKVRIGRSKHPFGIYTEIFDIGTLRPFFHLPVSMYGPSEIAAQSYNGIGVTGTRSTGSRGSIDYDVYTGAIRFDATQRVENAAESFVGISDVIGGRLRYQTPIDGLSFGASAYTGQVPPEEETTAVDEHSEGKRRHTGVGIHTEYAALPYTIRAELGHQKEQGEGESNAGYVELAYRIGDHVELATRFDRFDFSARDGSGEDLEHRDIAVGASYWFNPDFVLKLSAHRVRGLAVARPTDLDDVHDKTSAIVFGAQFTF